MSLAPIVVLVDDCAADYVVGAINRHHDVPVVRVQEPDQASCLE